MAAEDMHEDYDEELDFGLGSQKLGTDPFAPESDTTTAKSGKKINTNNKRSKSLSLPLPLSLSISISLPPSLLHTLSLSPPFFLPIFLLPYLSFIFLFHSLTHISFSSIPFRTSQGWFFSVVIRPFRKKIQDQRFVSIRFYFSCWKKRPRHSWWRTRLGFYTG